jgi:spore coat protein A, manganese oxidase
LLGAPIPHRTIRIAQAERFDVIIDFSKYDVGDEVTLKNRMGEGRTADVMRFRVTRKEKDESTIPRRLSDMTEFDKLEESSANHTREFRFTRVGDAGRTMWGINGEPFDPGRMAARPELGSTEVWHLRAAPASHPIHLHLVHFKGSPATTVNRSPPTLAGRTPWASARARRRVCWSASTATGAATSSTVTTSSTRT